MHNFNLNKFLYSCIFNNCHLNTEEIIDIEHSKIVQFPNIYIEIYNVL